MKCSLYGLPCPTKRVRPTRPQYCAVGGTAALRARNTLLIFANLFEPVEAITSPAQRLSSVGFVAGLSATEGICH